MIPFARSQDNTLVSIDAVAPGLACHCHCPSCGTRLIARKGTKNTHHFAHYRRPECIQALESSLHLLAKTILQREDRIVLPPVFMHKRKEPLTSAQLFQYGGVRMEVSQGRFVPDLVLESPNRKIYVEIAVHHFSPRAKVWQLQQKGIGTIEIDILSIYRELAGMGRGYDLELFTDRIVHGIRHKQWLFNPGQHYRENQLRATAQCKKVRQVYKQFYLVDDCPLYKRFYRSGPSEGKSYANVFSDCFTCEHCFEIEYEKKHVGYRHISTQPKRVYCTHRTISTR